MTVKEYIISQLGFSPANLLLVDGTITDQGLNGAIEYTVEFTKAAKMAQLTILQTLLSTADIDQGEGETHIGIKYDRAAILKRIAILEGELGLSLAPTITSRRVW